MCRYIFNTVKSITEVITKSIYKKHYFFELRHYFSQISDKK